MATLTDAAARLGVPCRALMDLIARGDLRPSRAGAELYLSRGQVERLAHHHDDHPAPAFEHPQEAVPTGRS